MPRTIITALMLLLLGVFVFKVFVVVLFGIAIAISCLLKAFKYIIVKITGKGEIFTRQQLIKDGIYVFTFILIVAANVISYNVVASRAELIITCCEEYKQKHGEYPGELNDLVPEFIDKIPTASWPLSGSDSGHFDGFNYSSTGTRTRMFYYAFPPWPPVRYYDFKDHKWRTQG